MLKTRLIPVLYIKNGLIVRSEDFSYHQNIGNIINEASRYNEWDVDELIYIDISREKHYDLRRDDHKIKTSETIDQVIMDKRSRVQHLDRCRQCDQPLGMRAEHSTCKQCNRGPHAFTPRRNQVLQHSVQIRMMRVCLGAHELFHLLDIYFYQIKKKIAQSESLH